MVGSIGLYSPDEPLHFLAARAMPGLPSQIQGVTTGPVTMGTAYAMIDGDSLLLDLGNSIPTQAAGGPILTGMGKLYAAALPANGTPVLLGEIEYQTPDWYSQTSGIVRLELTKDQLKAAQSSPLAIAASSILQQPPALASQPLLAEASNGTFLRADQFVFRLNPGDAATIKLYATTFGQRSPNQQISLGYDPTVMQGQVTQRASLRSAPRRNSRNLRCNLPNPSPLERRAPRNCNSKLAIPAIRAFTLTVRFTA